MKSTLLAAAVAATALIATPALADPIVGNWRTGEGGSVAINACGSAFCVKVTAGEHAGKQIGRFNKDGDRYVGRITDPTEDREYKGNARLSGNSLNVTGCWAVCTPVTSRTETWTRR